MLVKDFKKVFDDTMVKCASVLVKKGVEYATTDQLHNFKVAAALKDISVREALSGMMVKHTVSIYDMLPKEECASLEQWDEKIIDHINYLILLRAIIIEELNS